MGPLSSAPHEVQRYVGAVGAEVAAVFAERLLGMYPTGSLALGGYREGRSDVDLMVVVDEATTSQLRDVAHRVDHSRLRCPATGLELVVYPRATVTSGTTDAGFLLNLNTGAELATVASLDPGSAPAYWFVIDRAVTYQSGRALIGPEPKAYFRSPSWEELLAVVTTAVEAQRPGEDDLLDNVVLNACRALRFAEDRRWYAKPEAGTRTVAGAGPFADLIRAALATHEQGRAAGQGLPVPAVESFQAHVLEALRRARS